MKAMFQSVIEKHQPRSQMCMEEEIEVSFFLPWKHLLTMEGPWSCHIAFGFPAGETDVYITASLSSICMTSDLRLHDLHC